MREGIESRSVAPGRDLPAESVLVREAIEPRPGVRFSVVVDRGAADPISEGLAAGVFPPAYQPLLALLEGLVPPGGRVLDLGTHIGAFTLSAAALGYEVLGVEASPRNAALLRASLERNGFDRVRLVHAAAVDRPGVLRFRLDGPYSHLALDGPGEAGEVVEVPGLAVDDLLDEQGWGRVDLVKIDIEGAEPSALVGLRRLLSRSDAPPVFIESNRHTLGFFGQTPGDLKAALEALGYRNHLVQPGRLRPVTSRELQPATCVDYLALKGRGPSRLPRGWRIDGPLRRSEVVGMLVDGARSDLDAERAATARALLEAPAALIRRRPVERAVRALRADPSEPIRELANAIRLPSRGRGWIASWFRTGSGSTAQ